MELIHCQGVENVAKAYVGRFDDGSHVEFVESWDPDVPPQDKWVLIVSTLHGCPIGCAFCDASGFYKRKLTAAEILHQILHLVRARYPDMHVPIGKFKIQFARVGEPSFNPAVLEVLKRLPEEIVAPGLLPCLSTVAPSGSESFFAELTTIKERLYPGGIFQLQFSVHSTDDGYRHRIIPARIWNLEQISLFGEKWFTHGDRKITLNFALGVDFPFDPDILSARFDPERFLVKITPINPTARKVSKDMQSVYPLPDSRIRAKVAVLRSRGFTVLESIGNLEENAIGTNCGQYLTGIHKDRLAAGPA